MQVSPYDTNAPKKSTNLSINSDLLRKAKDHHINLSKALEQRLVEMLLEEKRRQWREENRDAIEAYNRRIEAGVEVTLTFDCTPLGCPQKRALT